MDRIVTPFMAWVLVAVILTRASAVVVSAYTPPNSTTLPVSTSDPGPTEYAKLADACRIPAGEGYLHTLRVDVVNRRIYCMRMFRAFMNNVRDERARVMVSALCGEPYVARYEAGELPQLREKMLTSLVGQFDAFDDGLEHVGMLNCVVSYGQELLGRQ